MDYKGTLEDYREELESIGIDPEDFDSMDTDNIDDVQQDIQTALVELDSSIADLERQFERFQNLYNILEDLVNDRETWG